MPLHPSNRSDALAGYPEVFDYPAVKRQNPERQKPWPEIRREAGLINLAQRIESTHEQAAQPAHH